MKEMTHRRFRNLESLSWLVAASILPIVVGISTYLVGEGKAEPLPKRPQTATAASTPEKPKTEAPPIAPPPLEIPKVSPEDLEAFLTRAEQAHTDSKFHQSKDLLRSELQDAKAVKLLATTHFESGQQELGSESNSALLTDLQQRIAFEELTSDPEAVVVVLGYADPAGAEVANNRVALARAQSVQKTVIELQRWPTYSWYVGETNRFGQAADLNRVAEVWLIVPRTKVIAGIGSDDMPVIPVSRQATTPAPSKTSNAPVYRPTTSPEPCYQPTKAPQKKERYIDSLQYRRLQMLRRRNCR